MKFAALLGQKKDLTPKVKASTMINVYTKEVAMVNTLNRLTDLWYQARKDSKPIFNWYVHKEDTYSAYFTPYSFEDFCNYFKELIMSNQKLSSMNISNYELLKINLTIFKNVFKGNEAEPQFVRSDEFQTFEEIELSADFSSSLELLNYLIFFDYEEGEFHNLKDSNKEYQVNLEMAKLLRSTYLSENNVLDKFLATYPTLTDFKNQDESSIFIPALRTDPESEVQQTEQEVQKQEEIAQEEPESTEDDPYARLGQRPELIDKQEEHQEYEESKEVEKKVEQEEPKAQEDTVTVKESTEDTTEVKIQEEPTSPVDPKQAEFDSLVNNNAISKQLFGNKDFLSTNNLKFQRFKVDDVESDPLPLEEAIKSDDFNSQYYVIQQDKNFKMVANEFIDQREKLLRLAFKRQFLGIIKEGFSELDKQVESVRNHYLDDTNVVQNAKDYYDSHFTAYKEKMTVSRDEEIKSELEELEKEYAAKKKRIVDSINFKYESMIKKSSDDINSQAVNLMNTAREHRNDELEKTIKQLKSEALTRISTDISDHSIEFNRQFLESGNKIFTMLSKAADNNVVAAIDEVSQMMDKQIKFNKSVQRVQEAKAKADSTSDIQEMNDQNQRIIKELEERNNVLEHENIKHHSERAKLIASKADMQKVIDDLTNNSNHDQLQIAQLRDRVDTQENRERQSNTRQNVPTNNQQQQNQSSPQQQGLTEPTPTVSATERVAIVQKMQAERELEEARRKLHDRDLAEKQKNSRWLWQK